MMQVLFVLVMFNGHSKHSQSTEEMHRATAFSQGKYPFYGLRRMQAFLVLCSTITNLMVQ